MSLAVKLYIADCSSVQITKEYLQRIPVSRRAKIQRYTALEDRQRSLTAGLLLNSVLHVSDDSMLKEQKDGKPVLCTGVPHFNISHSGEWAVLGVCEKEIGVDIECPKSSFRYGKITSEDRGIISHLFNSEEALWIGDSLLRFYKMWTAYEAVIKADGSGFGMLEKKRTFSLLDSEPKWHIFQGEWENAVYAVAARQPIKHVHAECMHF